MAYSDSTKRDAFLLYCDGRSFREIAEILKTHPGCEQITHSTIERWANDTDAGGRTWKERKQEVTVLVEKKTTATAVERQKRILNETDTIIDNILNDLKNKGLVFKTKDAAVYAFKALAEWQKKIKDEEKRITIEDQVTLFLEAMNAIPEVKEVLSKHWDDIHKRFQIKAQEMMRQKKHG